ncbi:hypothetical protein [Rhizobium sp. Leaf383]|uniref:hypothetical protein n=1 Tax=Rhizobium sp. Leaf383 TaxID=1736357 RepID=UPI0007124074|nr:hypothetical protein [Rhizobium sp. Leaf383]KQS84275.1 hypothetical protein ASG58_21125 [Rhizobium sp. Leaf383]
MFQNTFEHGYHDGIRGRQRLLNNPDYRSGYETGCKRLKSDQRLSLWVSAFLILVVAVAITVLAANAVAQGMPV